MGITHRSRRPQIENFGRKIRGIAGVDMKLTTESTERTEWELKRCIGALMFAA
jgi:hypothetical protein